MTDPPHDEKKEKVLHTRVSDTLDRELRRRAGALGVSVSRLVRNVLQNAVGLVDRVVADSAEVVRSVGGPGGLAPPAQPSGQAGAARRPSSPGAVRIIGWHRAILNLNAICAQCNAILPRGTEAGISIAEHPGSRAIICLTCLEEISHEPDEPAGAAGGPGQRAHPSSPNARPNARPAASSGSQLGPDGPATGPSSGGADPDPAADRSE